MESYSTRLLALIFALVITRASESQAQPAGLAESARPELPQVAHEKPAETTLPEEFSAGEQPKLAWDCVPSYWWGYWTWAWQPCAWIDRNYVEGAIGAIAEAPQTEKTKELTQSHL